MRRELPSEQRKQRMSERMAVDDPWVSAVSQRSCPWTNGDRSYRLTANKKKERTQIFTRCQGDRCVVNRREGLTAVDFGRGDAATIGAIDGVGKVPLLVGVDATVVVHKEDGLV
ncbi:hypothetical protein BHE74_00021130 [Ensete ventricosum]|nr:hypothetical protein BHE74_00021130 [Ensete ventricosum]RZR98390.1 hypothetical protein BHM03_00027733 [Ensete ventricosum]